jgi:radical SAM superfamily enzyme YgiQ (UPF0313 family)
MGKSQIGPYRQFAEEFADECRRAGKKQFITCYFMVSHPGCDRSAMGGLKRFIARELHFKPQQVQIFTPTPSTWSTCMYHTGLSPDGDPIYVPKSLKEKIAQKKEIV